MGDDITMKYYEIQAELIETKVTNSALRNEFDRFKDQMEKDRRREQADFMEAKVELASMKRENTQLREQLENNRRKNTDERIEQQNQKIAQIERNNEKFVAEVKQFMKNTQKSDEIIEELKTVFKKLNTNLETSGKRSEIPETSTSENHEISYTLTEIGKRPWLNCPNDYEVECMWNKCDKRIPLILKKRDIVFCVHCMRDTPIADPPEGEQWIYFHECAHVASIPTGNKPNNCLTCGKKKAFTAFRNKRPSKKE